MISIITNQLDPTKTTARRKKAKAKSAERLRSAAQQINEQVAQYLSTGFRVNELSLTETYAYDRILADDSELRAIVEAILNLNFETQSDIKPQDFWLDSDMQGAALAGWGAAYGTLVSLIGEFSQNKLQAVIVPMAKKDGFEAIKKFAPYATSRVVEAIKGAMLAQEPPAKAAKAGAQAIAKLKKTLGASVGNAITSVNKIARIQAMQTARAVTGHDIRCAHKSALLPTTRRSHADRHGRISTINDWWSWQMEGNNRYNCYCVPVPILMRKGKPAQKGLLAKMAEQRKRWLGV